MGTKNETNAVPLPTRRPAQAPAQSLADPLTQPGGPVGRLYDRVGGGRAPGREQLSQYLKGPLGFAEGEWFRDMKVSGATDGLMGQLDGNGDGKLGWKEFGAFEGETLKALAPGLPANASPEQVAKYARAGFSAVNTDRKGGVGLGELQAAARQALPKGTEHPDLVAQLGARLALDAADTDQRRQPVAKRTLSQKEWINAASEIAARQRK